MRHFNWWKRRKIVSTGFAVTLHLLTEPGSRTLWASDSQCRRVLLYIHSHRAVLVSTHLHRAPRSLSPWGEGTGSHRCHPLLLSLLRLRAPPSNSSVEGVHIPPAFIIPENKLKKRVWLCVIKPLLPHSQTAPPKWYLFTHMLWLKILIQWGQFWSVFSMSGPSSFTVILVTNRSYY